MSDFAPLPRGHWTVSEDFLVIAAGARGVPGIQWREVRDAAEHPTVFRAIFHNRELSGPNVSSAEAKNLALALPLRDSLNVLTFHS